MGTKNNPGHFDCYDAAEPDEPMFVLLARDPLAAFLVSIWAHLRQGDAEAAAVVFDVMLDKYLQKYWEQPDVDKSLEAAKCSVAMFDWRSSNRP